MTRRSRSLSHGLTVLMFLVSVSSVAVPLSRKQDLQPDPQTLVQDTTIMSLREFLGYVKKHHPIV
ncbi:MAG: transporter, partial [Nonlabens sp.]